MRTRLSSFFLVVALAAAGAASAQTDGILDDTFSGAGWEYFDDAPKSASEIEAYIGHKIPTAPVAPELPPIERVARPPRHDRGDQRGGRDGQDR